MASEYRQWIKNLKKGDQVAIYQTRHDDEFACLATVDSVSHNGRLEIIIKDRYYWLTFGASGKSFQTPYQNNRYQIKPVTQVELNMVRQRALIEKYKQIDTDKLSLEQLEAIERIITGSTVNKDK